MNNTLEGRLLLFVLQCVICPTYNRYIEIERKRYELLPKNLKDNILNICCAKRITRRINIVTVSILDVKSCSKRS